MHESMNERHVDVWNLAIFSLCPAGAGHGKWREREWMSLFSSYTGIFHKSSCEFDEPDLYLYSGTGFTAESLCVGAGGGYE